MELLQQKVFRGKMKSHWLSFFVLLGHLPPGYASKIGTPICSMQKTPSQFPKKNPSFCTASPQQWLILSPKKHIFLTQFLKWTFLKCHHWILLRWLVNIPLTYPLRNKGKTKLTMNIPPFSMGDTSSKGCRLLSCHILNVRRGGKGNQWLPSWKLTCPLKNQRLEDVFPTKVVPFKGTS